MDLRQLRYFLAVTEHGSFSAAAASVGVSQPSLSTSVKNLETELGDALLVRGPKGVSLTPLGTTFRPYARSIVREAERALDEVRVAQSLKPARVAFGLSAVFSSFVGPEAIELFRRENGGVEVQADVSTHGRETIVASLLEGAWDFAVSHGILARDVPESIGTEIIARFESSVYASSSHPLARRRTIEPADLAAYEWIGGSWNLAPAMLAREFSRRGIEAPPVRVVSSSFNLLRELAAGSAVLCMLPDRFARRDVAARRLVRLRQDFLSASNPLFLMKPLNRPTSPAAERLMQAFRTVAAGLQEQPRHAAARRASR